MTIKIPQNLKYIQSNRSNIFGNLWSTFNMDFQSNLGVARVSPRLKINKSTADLANLGCPVAFSPFNTRLYTVAGTRIFVGANDSYPNSTFSEDGSTNARTDYDPNYSDLCQFNNQLFATSPSNLGSLDGPGGTWTSRDTFGTTDEVHKLLYFKKTNRLYYSQTHQFINSMDTAYTAAETGDYTLQWNNLVALTDMKASTDSIWIAGKISNGSQSDVGTVWRWDGVVNQIAKEYKIAGTRGIYALAIDTVRDTPYAMGDNGVVYAFTGSGFIEVGRLPFTKHLPYGGSEILSSTNKADRFIHPNGMTFDKNGDLLCLINGRNDDNAVTQNENIPSGIWAWNKDTGFVHRQSFSYDPATSSITDFGQNKIARVGALTFMNTPGDDSGRDGTLMCGATYYTNATTTTNAIFYDNSIDTIRKAGYFVTTWLMSNGIQDTWRQIWGVFRRLLTSTDRIIFKYRLEEEAPIEATITWVNTTSFTTTTDITAYAPTVTGFDGTYGGEVEILQGTGGGNCRHITAIVNNAGTYTVTLDTAVIGVTTGTAKARFQKWIKLLPVIDQQVIGYQSFPIALNSTRLQIKVYMELTGANEFHRIIVDNTEFLDSQG
jgi:hypothetical protein